MRPADLHPEQLLGQYDVVFAKARAALEALAVGAAVVLCDAVGLGPLVTTHELDALRRGNFGLRTLRHRHSVEALEDRLRQFDPDDAAEVSRRIRATAGREAALDAILALYRDVLDQPASGDEADAAAEGRAAAEFLRSVAPIVQQASAAPLRQALHRAEHERAQFAAECEQLRYERDEGQRAAADRQMLAAECDALRRSLSDRQHELDTVHAACEQAGREQQDWQRQCAAWEQAHGDLLRSDLHWLRRQMARVPRLERTARSLVRTLRHWSPRIAGFVRSPRTGNAAPLPR